MNMEPPTPQGAICFEYCSLPDGSSFEQFSEKSFVYLADYFKVDLGIPSASPKKVRRNKLYVHAIFNVMLNRHQFRTLHKQYVSVGQLSYLEWDNCFENAVNHLGHLKNTKFALSTKLSISLAYGIDLAQYLAIFQQHVNVQHLVRTLPVIWGRYIKELLPTAEKGDIENFFMDIEQDLVAPKYSEKNLHTFITTVDLSTYPTNLAWQYLKFYFLEEEINHYPNREEILLHWDDDALDSLYNKENNLPTNVPNDEDPQKRFKANQSDKRKKRGGFSSDTTTAITIASWKKIVKAFQDELKVLEDSLYKGANQEAGLQ